MTQLGQWLFEKQLENTAQLIRELRAYTATVVTADIGDGVVTITDPISQTTDATLIPVLGQLPAVGARVLIIPYGSGQRMAVAIRQWSVGYGLELNVDDELQVDYSAIAADLAFEFMPAAGIGTTTTQPRVNMRYLANMGAGAAVTLTANRQYYIPFYCNDGFVADGMGIDVMTFVAGDVQLGLYAASNTYAPSTQLAVCAKTTVTSTGIKDFLFPTGYGLQRNTRYCLSVCSTSAMAIRGSTGDNMTALRGGFSAPGLLTTHSFQTLAGGWTGLPASASGTVSSTNTFLDIYLNT